MKIAIYLAILPVLSVLVVAGSSAEPMPTITPQSEGDRSTLIPLPDRHTMVQMVLVPGGKFIMGASSKEQEQILQFGLPPNWMDRIKPLVESSGPPHNVYLDSFYISKYEVTNRQYEAFVEATGHMPPSYPLFARAQFTHLDQPVVGVSWHDANAFCTWAGMRLPTEAEWEKAARGSEGLVYPWGHAWDTSKSRSADSIANRPLETFNVWRSWRRNMRLVHGSEARPAKVGSYPEGASPYGVMDMAGNVWEWVADWYDPHYYTESPERNPKGPPTGQRRVLRGGGWNVPKVAAYSWLRETFMPPHDKRGVTGFRCATTTTVASAPPSPSALPGASSPASRRDTKASFPSTYSVPARLQDGWEVNHAQAEGLDSASLGRAVHLIRNGSYKNIDSMLIVKNNKLVLETYSHGWNRTMRHDLRSATKSVTSALVGIALDKGFIKNTDQSAWDSFPTYKPFKNWSETKKDITIRHLLTMSTGLECNDRKHSSVGNEEKMYKTWDWVKFFLNLPVAETPGAKFSYCTAAPVTLGGIVSETLGKPVPEFAKDVLFGPLGIENYHWEYMPSGRADTGGHLHMTPRDMAKFGLLFLNGGEWKGARIISESWTRESVQWVHDFSPFRGYGYLWWLNKWQYKDELITSFSASGNGGQYIMVFPDLDMVVVFTGGNYNSKLAQQPFYIVHYFILQEKNGYSVSTTRSSNPEEAQILTPGERWTGTTKGKGRSGCGDFDFSIVTNKSKITGWAYTANISWKVWGNVTSQGHVYIRAETNDPRAHRTPYAVWTGEMSDAAMEISQPSSINCYIEPRKGTLTRSSQASK